MITRRIATPLAAIALMLGAGSASAADLPAEAQNFLKVCNGQMSTIMERQFNAAMQRIEAKATDDQKNRMKAAMTDARNAMSGMCPCMAGKINESTVLSAEEKSKIWAVKSMSRKDLPELSKEKKAHMRTVTSGCFTSIRPKVVAANQTMIKIMQEVSKQ